jgi:hypothetical protein
MKTWWNIYTKIAIVVIFILGFAIWIAFFSPLLSFCQIQYIRFQSLLAVVSAIAIIFTLIYATIQFRKLIARPNIKVRFNDSDSNEVSAVLRKGEREFHTQKICDIFVTNTGDAVAMVFQIDFEVPLSSGIAVPEIYENRFRPYITISKRTWNNREFLSICNNGMPFFVNLPIKVAWLEWRTEPAYSTNLPFNLEIKYSVFGNWSGKQEGTLKVKVISEPQN